MTGEDQTAPPSETNVDARAPLAETSPRRPLSDADHRSLDELRSECEKVGLPLTAAGLVRHWCNNTAATYALDLHTACHLIGELLEGRDDELARRGRAFLAHLEESKATAEDAAGSGAQQADDVPPVRFDSATGRAVIDWEAHPVPTNHQIAAHLRAGGKIVKRWDESSSGWAENPCGNYDPVGWAGTEDDPAPEFEVDDYRLVPLLRP